MGYITGRLAVASFLLLLSSVRCQADDTQAELRAIREQLSLIRREQLQLRATVDAILAALSGKDAPPKGVSLSNVSTTTRNLPARGKETARVGVMEFSDYQCGYCREYFMNTMQSLEDKYIKPGKIRYYVRDFPLTAIHPQAERLAEASHCAGEIGRYWELRASLFMNQSEGVMDNSLRAAIPSSDRPTFDRCMAEARYLARVRDDVSEGKRLGIKGTPEFLVGYLDDPSHPGELKCVRRLSGAVRADEFEAAIESVLAGAPQPGGGGQKIKSTTGYDGLVPESALGAFIGRPVPVVRADDLRRVWSFLASERGRGPGSSVDMKLLASLCDPDADVFAVWFRATLVETLLQQGRLDRWREGNGMRDKVFEVAAGFPFPQGPGNADLDGFVAALE